MFTSTANKVKTVRFSRWSRAGYAIFLSLSVVVTIGVLTSSVSEKSLLKSNAIPNVFSESQISLFTENEPDDDVLFEQIAEIIVNEQTTDIAAAQCHNLLYINPKSVEWTSVYATDFFIQPPKSPSGGL